MRSDNAKLCASASGPESMPAIKPRTLLGAIPTYLHRWLRLPVGGARFETTYNFVRIDERLTTSGQPTAKQLRSLPTQGIDTVINLAPHDAENALRNEADCLAALGMTYIHIPVDFKNPTEADFARFCQHMQALRDQPLHVHCAANMRVSAFIYRWRVQVLGEDATTAQRDLHRIWEPFGVWREFIARAKP